jgi:hypothetical protein
MLLNVVGIDVNADIDPDVNVAVVGGGEEPSTDGVKFASEAEFEVDVLEDKEASPLAGADERWTYEVAAAAAISAPAPTAPAVRDIQEEAAIAAEPLGSAGTSRSLPAAILASVLTAEAVMPEVPFLVPSKPSTVTFVLPPPTFISLLWFSKLIPAM